MASDKIYGFYTILSDSFVLLPLTRDVSSVGSERYPHTVEVTGSNPVHPTKNPALEDQRPGFHFHPEGVKIPNCSIQTLFQE